LRCGHAIRAEREVLFHCARADPGDGDSLRMAVARVGDWDALIDAADFHGLGPLLHRTIDRARPDSVPPHAAKLLDEADRESAKRGLALSAALLAMLDTLSADGIAALPLKGPVLAAALYSDPALRPSSDIDLLVRREAIPAALQVLAGVGYTLDQRLRRLPVQTLLAVNCEVTVRHPQGVPLDLHWEIAQRGYPFRFDPEILWRAVRPSRLHGREVPGLEPEGLLLYLCVHGAKHLWSHLMWLGDVARLAQASPDWDAAMSLASGVGCVRPVLLGLLLAHDLLDAHVPASLVARARTEPAVAEVACETARSLCRIPPVEPGFELTAFNARMAERTWDKAKHYAAWLAPSEAELQLLRLPSALRPLYYPFRIARLASKYTLKLARH
jgi:hypothetical protein